MARTADLGVPAKCQQQPAREKGSFVGQLPGRLSDTRGTEQQSEIMPPRLCRKLGAFSASPAPPQQSRIISTPRAAVAEMAFTI
ncbi:hypothetical protein T190_00500 [Sinorhizobium meliloti CCBAU 01290]|nr:hypothetical protein T190_00500 [Sinorhizobium meliloti CCBAU 01290]